MKKSLFYISLALILILLASTLVGCGSKVAIQSPEKKTEQPVEKKEPVADKKGILVVSFGTSYADTRKVTIEACENKIAESYPDYEVRRAFTSNIIRKILKDRDNITVDSPEDALKKMQEDGFTEIIVQPLHIIPGEEYNKKILTTAAKFNDSFKKLVVGRPILTTIDDYKVAVEALRTQLPKLKKGQAVVLMGHGTHHPANSSYSQLQLVLMDTIPNVFIGTVEGYPAFEDVLTKLKANGIKEVTLMPYMLVAGDHAQNDMAGDEDESWKTMLKKEGFVVNTYLHGLGENPEYQEIYVDHIKDAIEGQPMGHH